MLVLHCAQHQERGCVTAGLGLARSTRAAGRESKFPASCVDCLDARAALPRGHCQRRAWSTGRSEGVS